MDRFFKIFIFKEAVKSKFENKNEKSRIGVKCSFFSISAIFHKRE